MPYANNKGADQPAHPRSLISTFVVHCPDSISSFYIDNFMTLASFFSWADRFESYLVENPKDSFSRDEAHIWKWRDSNEFLSETPELLGTKDKLTTGVVRTFA